MKRLPVFRAHEPGAWLGECLPMPDAVPFRPVIVETDTIGHRPGGYGAGARLAGGGEGEAYRGALHACYEALEGELDVEDARDAFIAAAQEAGIAVPEGGAFTRR